MYIHVEATPFNLKTIIIIHSFNIKGSVVWKLRKDSVARSLEVMDGPLRGEQPKQITLYYSVIASFIADLLHTGLGGGGG